MNAATFNYHLAVSHLQHELGRIGDTIVLTPEESSRVAERIREVRRTRTAAMNAVGAEYPEMRHRHVD